jgi:hypothetical protein
MSQHISHRQASGKSRHKAPRNFVAKDIIFQDAKPPVRKERRVKEKRDWQQEIES